MKEPFEVYVTNYALTKGIQKIKVEKTTVDSMVCSLDRYSTCYHGEGNQWHRTWDAALEKAKDMKQKKIKSLKKQLKKIEKLEFKEIK